MALDRAATATALLDDFAARTGVPDGDPLAGPGDDLDAPPTRRYLWTDAHAVCAWLGLHARTGDARFLRRATGLAHEVHRVLGRHRPDDPRKGWLSGLPDDEGMLRPTAGGLRIGKSLPDRPADEPPDPDTEWDRDGQYFHYLTRWMHALHRLHRDTGELRWHRHAVELARVAWDAFVIGGGSGGPERMVWKRSVDLTRVTVPSMGHHDPLDGLETYATLQAVTDELAASGALTGLDPVPSLEIEIESFEAMCEGRSWATKDPLGIGGLLDAAWREGWRIAGGRATGTARLKWLCREGWRSLESARRELDPAAPPARRLAFRELGLSLGLHAAERLVLLAGDDPELSGDEALGVRLDALVAWAPLADAYEASWLDPAAREAPSWRDHEDINAVMLASSLVPGGWLG